jgi:hypothetical protein
MNWLKKLLKFDEVKILAEGFHDGYTQGLEVGKKEQEELIERKAINMFCDKGYPNPLHVFDVTKQKLPDGKVIEIPYLAQEPLKKERAKQLKSEATLLKGMDLYTVLLESLRHEAVVKVLKSEKWDDVFTGKTMLVNLAIIRRIVDTISTVDIDNIPAGVGGASQNLV